MATQSPAISPTITAAVNAALGAVVDTADKSTNNIHPKSVDDAKPELKAAMTKAVSADPLVQYATNTEANFWQRRSFWGAVGAGLSCAAAVAGAVIIYMQAHTSDTGGALTVSVFGALTAAWGGYSSWKAGHSIAPLWTDPPKPNP